MKSILNKLKEFIFFRRAKTYCPVCKMENIKFDPLPDYYRQNALANGFKYFGQGEMTAHETYTCSNCGASDRERLYALWIQQQINKKLFSNGACLIHFAPETSLSRMLKGTGFFDYETADLLMEGVDYKVDMMEMPFKDESFDFFVCSHVLEHIESDDRAIREL